MERKPLKRYIPKGMEWIRIGWNRISIGESESLNTGDFKVNGSRDAVIASCAEVVRDAEHQIDMVSGDLDPEYFCGTTFFDTLNSVISDRNVHLRIITVVGPSAKSRMALGTIKDAEAKIELYTVPQRPTHPFIIADGRHVQIEEPYLPNSPERVAVTMYDGNYEDWVAPLVRSFNKLLSVATKESLHEVAVVA
ncbi:MAG: hypothetical protein Q8R11_00480 [bacterium]|nr:hypothetical protein [bacterium]